MNQKLKEAYARGRKAGISYILYRIHSASIALSIALPSMALWQVYKQISIHKHVSEVQAVYWFTLVTSFSAALLAYYLAGYASRANTTPKQWRAAFAFLGIFVLGFIGFVFIRASK